MPVVVAFISQKGGVGKSTLARALAAVVAYAGQKVRIADIDAHQGTAVRWQSARSGNRIRPQIDVRSYAGIAEAMSHAGDCDLLVVDTAGGANRETLNVAEYAHLIVQPTGPSVDDLEPGVLLFHELTDAGVPRDRLAFALCRTQTAREERDARAYLEDAGYAVLPGALPERALYRDAQNRGHAITETGNTELNQKADALMVQLMRRVAHEVAQLRTVKRAPEKKRRRGV